MAPWPWAALAVLAAGELAPGDLSVSTAVGVALERNPQILTRRAEIEAQRGQRRQAGGPFDYELQSSAGYSSNFGPPISGLPPQETRIATFDVALEKQFRVGTTISPRVQLQRVEVAGLQEPASLATVAFEVTQPLARDLGLGVSASERASRELVKAAVEDFNHALAEQVRATVRAYWLYRAAQLRLAVSLDAEDRFEALFANLKALVDADERPRADLEQVSASLADRRRSRIDAEREVADARLRLGLEMGLDRSEVRALGSPETEMPAIGPEPPASERWTELARAARRDLRAAEHRLEAAQLITEAALTEARPALDLTGSIGYSGAVDGGDFSDFWFALGDGIEGANGSVRLTFAWPILNAARGGAKEAAVAARRQARIDYEQLHRELGPLVDVAVIGVRLQGRSVAEARRALEHFQTAVENERTKLGLGLATIIDVVLTEDRLTSGLLAEISTTTDYALALVELRFATGTLVEIGDLEGAFDPAVLIRAPRFQP